MQFTPEELVAQACELDFSSPRDYGFDAYNLIVAPTPDMPPPILGDEGSEAKKKKKKVKWNVEEKEEKPARDFENRWVQYRLDQAYKRAEFRRSRK